MSIETLFNITIAILAGGSAFVIYCMYEAALLTSARRRAQKGYQGLLSKRYRASMARRGRRISI